MSEEEVLSYMRNKESLTNIVAAKDNKPGCPEIRWDGPYSFRCGLGVNKCAIHGTFPVQYFVDEVIED